VSWSRVAMELEKATAKRLELEKVKGMECELE
jgi:hypothetical protein